MDPLSLPVVCLMGPTASGKTQAAYAIAERFPVEIISVDAAQVYRGMDIGTAKASAAERRRYPHHLVDIVDPGDTYSAARFREDALALIDAVRARGRVPLLVGGTMFYFDALWHGLPDLPPADQRVRAAIAQRAAIDGWAALHAELQRLDPRRAAEIAPQDGQRIQRALEINTLTGRNVGRRRGFAGPAPGPAVRIVLAPADRGVLHRRIAARFRTMLAQGLVAEVAGLLEKFAGGPEPPALRMVGYRQVVAYLRGRVRYTRMTEGSIAATRRLAKRQLTWLRRQSAVTWVDSDHPESGPALCRYLESHPRMAGLGSLEKPASRTHVPR